MGVARTRDSRHPCCSLCRRERGGGVGGEQAHDALTIESLQIRKQDCPQVTESGPEGLGQVDGSPECEMAECEMAQETEVRLS